MMTQSWLWPNRTIGKVESGELRKEHNRLVNSHDLLNQEVRQLRRIIEVNAPGVDIEYNLANLSLLTNALITAKAIIDKDIDLNTADCLQIDEAIRTAKK